MINQVTKQLQSAADHFLLVKAEVLQNWRSVCHCTDPGTHAKCSTCPSFRAFIQQIHEQLASLPEGNFPLLLAPQVRRPYPNQVQQECLDLYELGYAPKEIQRLTGVTNLQDMRRWLNKAGLVLKEVDYPEETKEMCLQLYRDGLTREQIEQKTGVSANIVTLWVQKAGIARPKKAYSEAERQNCIELYLQGNSAKKVETLTGIPAGMVQKLVKQAGVKRERIYSGGRPQGFPPEFRQKCLDLLEQGYGTAQVGAMMNVSADTISRWRRVSLQQKLLES